jgi:hypothetical protein
MKSQKKFSPKLLRSTLLQHLKVRKATAHLIYPPPLSKFLRRRTSKLKLRVGAQ